MSEVRDTPAAVAVTSEQLVLGEGIRWDGRRDELLRLDILEGRVFRDRVAADGSLVPVEVRCHAARVADVWLIVQVAHDITANRMTVYHHTGREVLLGVRYTF